MADTQTIKDRIDIVQLISEYIQLKKAGINWKACCPFHQEKSPSFMVNAEKQFWHCFGCGKSGDIFSFIQEIEGVEFPEALRLLADRAGVKIDTFRSEINKSQKNRILEINEKSAFFFNKFLLEMDVSRNARSYLAERGLSQDTIKKWLVGYIPDQWELLTQYLLKNGFGIEDIVSAGLAIKKDNANMSTGRGYYDRFRGRIMFPICDVHNNIIGFTGRILVETEKTGGKYVNTPQTPVFDKSRAIYGLNNAKMEIKNQDLTVLVEGQMDVVACHQAGMKNVVAASGTALTFEQVKLLKRYSNNLAMAFDMDEAGIKAAKRGIDMALEQGMNIKVIQIPPGCGDDPDECIRKDKQVWFKAVEHAKEVMEWYFSINLKDLDLSNPKAKQQAAGSILAEIIRLPYSIEREHWIKELSNKTGVEIDALKEEAKRIKDQPQKKIGQNVQQHKDAPDLQVIVQVKGRHILDLESLFGLILSFPELFAKYEPRLQLNFFVGTWLKDLYEIVLEQYNTNDEIKIDLIEQFLSADLREQVSLLLLKSSEYYQGFSEKEAEREMEKVLKRVELGYDKNEMKKQAEKGSLK
ncbi:MAG: DNA primase [bacterium]